MAEQRLPKGVRDWFAALDAPIGEIRRSRSGAVIVLGLTPPPGASDLARVVKLHPAGTDSGALARRLELAGSPAAAGVLVAPSIAVPLRVPAEVADAWEGPWEWASVWPRLEVLEVGRSPGRDTWRRIGALAAELHRLPAPAGTPPAGDLARLDRALTRLGAAEGVIDDDVGAVLTAGRLARDALVGCPGSTLVHGDLHLGQLGRRPSGPWRLMDVDDLGVGCPATDLARPAGFWAAGLLADSCWAAFVEGYRRAGGPAIPADGDPWPALEVHARAAVVVAAAGVLVEATGTPADEGDWALVQACHRMLTHI